MSSLLFRLICEQYTELCLIANTFRAKSYPVVCGSLFSTVKVKDNLQHGCNYKPVNSAYLSKSVPKYYQRMQVKYGGILGATTRGIQTSACSLYSSQPVDQNDDELLGKGDKILRVKLNAIRLDAVLKKGLGLSRNKIEKALYDDRVRVNGQRPQKKSQPVSEGDEIDIVRGYNKLNPEKFIDVSRVEIEELGEEPDNDESGSESDSDEETKIPAVLRRSKLLTIRNYSPPWKGSSQD